MYNHKEQQEKSEKRMESFKKRMDKMQEQRMESWKKVFLVIFILMLILLFGGLYLRNREMYYTGLGMLTLMGIIAYLTDA